MDHVTRHVFDNAYACQPLGCTPLSHVSHTSLPNLLSLLVCGGVCVVFVGVWWCVCGVSWCILFLLLVPWCIGGFMGVAVLWCTHHGIPTTHNVLRCAVVCCSVLQCVAPWHTNNKQTNATAHQTFTTGCFSLLLVSMLWCKSGFADVGVPWCTQHGTPTTNKPTPRYTKHPHLQYFFLSMPGGFVGVGTGGFVGVDTLWHTNNKQTNTTAHQTSALQIVCILLFLVSLPSCKGGFVGNGVPWCIHHDTPTTHKQTPRYTKYSHLKQCFYFFCFLDFCAIV